jgi:hypothetical protein
MLVYRSQHQSLHDDVSSQVWALVNIGPIFKASQRGIRDSMLDCMPLIVISTLSIILHALRLPYAVQMLAPAAEDAGYILVRKPGSQPARCGRHCCSTAATCRHLADAAARLRPTLQCGPRGTMHHSWRLGRGGAGGQRPAVAAQGGSSCSSGRYAGCGAGARSRGRCGWRAPASSTCELLLDPVLADRLQRSIDGVARLAWTWQCICDPSVILTLGHELSDWHHTGYAG